MSLSSPYKRTESLLRALLTALCKLLAGGNDFTKKVTPPPPARINEPFIHFRIYKKRTPPDPALATIAGVTGLLTSPELPAESIGQLKKADAVAKEI